MATTETVEQSHSVAWGVIVLMVVILAASLAGLYMMSAPIAGL